jgi:hypothetical protein
MAPHNVLIDSDGTARLIDWEWPTRGPGWVDPAVWVIRLIDAGHTPAQAEDWAAALPAWRTAPAVTLNAFAHANAALWQELAATVNASRWKGHMSASARRWSQHRQ